MSANPYARRLAAVDAYLEAGGLSALIVEDAENRRNPGLRWLSGQPGDALLFVFRGGLSVLLPWDVNLAQRLATAGEIVPYTKFKRSFYNAAAAILDANGCRPGDRVEISGQTPYTTVEGLRAARPDLTWRCSMDGMDAFLASMRGVKDDAELAIVRRAAEITNAVIDGIEEAVRAGKIASELDAAFFIEARARSLGAEGTGFETLAAAGSRSCEIHPFPAYTAAAFPGEGLSILDFGVRVDGYTTDVTLSFARGVLTEKQAQMIRLVEDAWDVLPGLIRDGAKALDIAAAVDAGFAAHGLAMPHALGHGVGLEAHEEPVLRNREDTRSSLAANMVLAVEPGLYQSGEGGVRLEQTLIVTDALPEILTRARIIRL